MKVKGLLAKLITATILLFLSMDFMQAYQGSYVWTKRMGGASDEWSRGIISDSSGNIYITGSFKDTVNFGNDFGVADTKMSAGDQDIFVTRINANGTYGWTRRIGGAYFDGSSGIATDPSGNVYVTGSFRGAVNFGADFGTTDTKTSAGDDDIFVIRINTDGTYGWTKRIGGALDDVGKGITVSSSGIYITGSFGGAVNFGADFGTTDTKKSAGGNDIFVTRINANVTYAWTRRIGGTSADRGDAITTDPSGNIFVAGFFRDTVDFGADFGTTDTRTSEGLHDIFITRIFSDGTYGGVRKIGGAMTEFVRDFTSDPWGNLYILGTFEQWVNFGADFGKTDIKFSAGEEDIFITRINANGSYGWTRRLGGDFSDDGSGIATDHSGNIYITGDFGDSLNFGADFGITDIKTAAGWLDMFVTKINVAKGTYVGTDRIGGTEFDQGLKINADPSGNVYVAGVFHDTVDFGADFGVADTKASEGYQDVSVTKLMVPLRIFDGHDFDGNSTSDAAVWRPSNGRWYIKDIGNFVWGTLGDIPVNGDYDGDETTDIAVWRPENGRWYLRGLTGTNWGTLGDIPVPGDYDGDGDTDLAVWRPSNGRWYIHGIGTTSWGTAGDLPVPGDYNGDGITEIAVWRPSNGRWYIQGIGTTSWGKVGDFPVPGDYNGDNTTEIAVWRPSNGRWYVMGVTSTTWGIMADIPVPGDYDGDGDTDLAVWRPSNGRWYFKDTAGYIWGTLGDIPLIR